MKNIVDSDDMFSSQWDKLDWQTMSCCLFLWIEFYRNTDIMFIYVLCIAAFSQLQSSVAGTETIEPVKLKIFLVLYQKKKKIASL